MASSNLQKHSLEENSNYVNCLEWSGLPIGFANGEGRFDLSFKMPSLPYSQWKQSKGHRRHKWLSLMNLIINHFNTYILMCMYMDVSEYMPQECKGLWGTEKGVGSLETVITGNFEQPNTGGRNWTWFI